jgi:DNA polymerase III, beta subunit
MIYYNQHYLIKGESIVKFTVKRTAFLNKLKDVQLAISTKATIPILTGIKLVVAQNGIHLTGSNSDISIETFIDRDDQSVDLTIEETGSIVLQPAHLFSNIVGKLPDTHFTVELDERNQAQITSASSSFSINGIEASKYPKLPDINLDHAFLLPTVLLKNIIRQTVIAVSNHESRPILTGVNLSFKDETLKAVATDSHRLSQRVIPLEGDHEETFNIVIPGKSLTELSKLLDENTSHVKLAIVDNQILFNVKDTYFYSRLLEGNYPATDRLIPEKSNTDIVLDVQTLLGAVERASLLSHQGKNNVVKLSATADQLMITGQSPEIGHVEEIVEFDSFTGDPIDISFNPDYLKQALNAFGVGEVTMKLLSTLQPFVLMPNDENKDFIQLITPIRTS